MSRGLGQIQRRVLEALTALRSEVRPELWHSLHRLLRQAGIAEDCQRSVLVSWRRAAHSLEERGLVELWYFAADGRQCLGLRLPLTEEERRSVVRLRSEAVAQLIRILGHGIPRSEVLAAENWLSRYNAPLEQDAFHRFADREIGDIRRDRLSANAIPEVKRRLQESRHRAAE